MSRYLLFEDVQPGAPRTTMDPGPHFNDVRADITAFQPVSGPASEDRKFSPVMTDNLEQVSRDC
jgi:hypothetical protein